MSIPGLCGPARRRGQGILSKHKHMQSASDKFGYFYIEIFSGTEMWARALRRRGCRVYTFDIIQGPEGDLLCRGAE